MLHTYISTALFVSFPEELLIVLITLISSGNKDLLIFKNRNNIFRLVLAVSLMVVSCLTLNMFFSFTFRFLINTSLFYIIIVLVYRQKPVSLLLGFFFSIIILMASEFIFFPVLAKITQIPLDSIEERTLYKVLFSIPDRLTQLVSLLIICKVKKVSLKVSKLYITDLIIILMYVIIIASSFMLLDEKGSSITDRDLISIFKITISTIIIVSFSLWLIRYIFSLRHKMYVKENIHDVELHHLKQLIQEGKSDYAIKLIDLTLKERGYYNND